MTGENRTPAPAVELDADQSRFVIRDPQGVSELRYNIIGSQIVLEHTEVPKALRGRGLADALARTALEYARVNQLAVIPVCPFVIRYLSRHPEYESLLTQPRPRPEP